MFVLGGEESAKNHKYWKFQVHQVPHATEVHSSAGTRGTELVGGNKYEDRDCFFKSVVRKSGWEVGEGSGWTQGSRGIYYLERND